MQHGADDEGVGQFTERLEGEGVVDGVGDFAGGVSERSDEVEMTPEFIGTHALFVNEGDSWIDVGDVGEPGFPDKRGELDLEPEHLSGVNGGDLIPSGVAHGEIWRGELAEVGRVGEKSPSCVCGDREGLSLMEAMDAHAKATNGGALWFGFRG